MLTVTDIFAGAGGSSTGAAAVPGVQIALAANHWQLGNPSETWAQRDYSAAVAFGIAARIIRGQA